MLHLANERYKVLFDSIRSGVAVYESRDGVSFSVVDFNQAAEKMEGIGKTDVIGRNASSVFPWFEPIGLLAAVRKVWETGNPERMPCSAYDDGRAKWWRDNYAYKLPSGEIVVVYDDVTQKRAKAERMSDNVGKLRDSETRLRGMFDNASVGLVVVGNPPEMPILNANRAFCEFVGYPRDELLKKGISDVTHPDDLKTSLESTNRARSLPSSSQPVSLTKRYVRKDGGIRWGTVFFSKIEHGDGRVEHFSQVVDVTERKSAEEGKVALAGAVARANGILSVQCEVAKRIASGFEGGLDSVMSMTVRKLKARWACVAIAAEDGVIGRWADDERSSSVSIEDDVEFSKSDVSEFMKWASSNVTYVGPMGGIPAPVSKFSKKAEGNWMVVPVCVERPHNMFGAMVLCCSEGRTWSKDECDAMRGLATMLCILTKGEKNRDDLSRKINETIASLSLSLSPAAKKDKTTGEHDA